MNVEYAILADYVDVNANKLYIIGGGWDTLTINDPHFQHTFGVAATFQAERWETDRPHDVSIQILQEQSGSPLADIQGSIEFADNSGQSKLPSERVHFGANLTIAFHQSGLYRLAIRVDEEIGKEFRFLVNHGTGVRDFLGATS